MQRFFFNIRFFFLSCWWILGFLFWILLSILFILFTAIIFLCVTLSEYCLKLKPPFFFKIKKKGFFYKNNRPLKQGFLCKKKPLFYFFFLLSFACSTPDLSPEGSAIEIVNQLDQKNCKNLGTVIGKGGGSFGGTWISDEHLLEYTLNDLRNHAAHKGATHIVTQTHQVGNSGGLFGATSTMTQEGIAYKCPKKNE